MWASSAKAQSPKVTVAIAGDEGSLEHALHDLFDHQYTMATHSVRKVTFAQVIEKPTQAGLARIFVDKTRAGTALLIIADDHRERILVRRFDRTDEAEVLQEELLHAISSSLHALQHGMAIGTAQDDALADVRNATQQGDTATQQGDTKEQSETQSNDSTSTPESEPTPAQNERPLPQKPARGIDVMASLGYDGVASGRGLWEHGPRIGALFAPHRNDAFLGFVEVAYHFGSQINHESIAGRLDRLSTQAGVSLGGGRPRIAFRASLGIDFVFPFINAVPSHQDSARIMVDGFVSPSLRLSHPLLDDLAIYAESGVDIYFLRSQWLVDDIVVVAPWVARPFVRLGIQAF